MSITATTFTESSGQDVLITRREHNTRQPSSQTEQPVSVLPLDRNQRNLVVCIDGTSNKFSEKSTNVVELFGHIEKSDEQLTYYNSGIGTYARPSWRGWSQAKRVVEKTVDLMVAWSFESDIMAAYEWLSDHYRSNDRIFLFGFSRGGYQIRVLAAMIHSVGLIYQGNKQQIPLDTVSSVGLRLSRPLPLTNTCAHISHARQALALDERRARFLPEYMVGDPKEGGTKKEVWFAGTHSDIGGGNKVNMNLDLGAEPLKWMMSEACNVGLSAKLHTEDTGIPGADITQSLYHVWWICEYLPISRRKYDQDGSSHTTRWPHKGRGRNILHDQLIHWTVWTGLKYRDNAALHDHREELFRYEPKATIKRADNSKVEWTNLANRITAASTEDGTAGFLPREPITWEGTSSLLKAIELIKTRPGSSDDSEIDRWQQTLFEYLTNGEGQPDLIWHYGGPKLLHDLVVSSHAVNTPAIIESVLGMKQKTSAENERQYRKTDGGQQDVVSRIFELLRQWVAPDDPLERPTGDRRPSWLRRTGQSNIIRHNEVKIAKNKDSFKSLISKVPDGAEIILKLVRSEISHPTNGQIAKNGLIQNDSLGLTRGALHIVARFDINSGLLTQSRWDEFISHTLYPLIKNTVSKPLVCQATQILKRLSHTQHYADTIAMHRDFPTLLEPLKEETQPQNLTSASEQQALVKDVLLTVTALIATQGLGTEYMNRINECLGPRVTDLVNIMVDADNPASQDTLPVIEHISRSRLFGLLGPEKSPLSNLNRVITRLLSLMSTTAVALNVLMTLESTHQFIEDTISDSILTQTLELFGSRVDHVPKLACQLVEMFVIHLSENGDESRRISAALVVLLESNKHELVLEALSVAKAMTKRALGFDEKFVNKLVVASAVENQPSRHVMLALLWIVDQYQPSQSVSDTLAIPLFTEMLNGPDAWLALEAMSALAASKKAAPSQMRNSNIVVSVTTALQLSIKNGPIGRYEYNPGGARTTILKVYPLIKTLSRDDATCAELAQSGVIKRMQLLNGGYRVRGHLEQRASSSRIALRYQLMGISWDLIRERFMHDVPNLPFDTATRGVIEQEVQLGLDLASGATEPASRTSAGFTE